MHSPDVPSSTNPRWSLKRWLVTLAIALMVTVTAYALTLAKRYHDRLAFQRRMEAVGVVVMFNNGWTTLGGWLRAWGYEGDVLRVLTGEINAGVLTEYWCDDPFPSPDVICTSAKVTDAFKTFESSDKMELLSFWGGLIDDRTLTELPPGLKMTSVSFIQTQVTEEGLRQFCRTYQPKRVSLNRTAINEEVVQRLETEFPGTEFALTDGL